MFTVAYVAFSFLAILCVLLGLLLKAALSDLAYQTAEKERYQKQYDDQARISMGLSEKLIEACSKYRKLRGRIKGAIEDFDYEESDEDEDEE